MANPYFYPDRFYSPEEELYYRRKQFEEKQLYEAKQQGDLDGPEKTVKAAPNKVLLLIGESDET